MASLLCLICKAILVLTRLLFSEILLLHPCWLLSPIQTTNHISCTPTVPVEEIFILSQRFLRKEMVSGGDLVVSISFNTLHGIVWVIIELIKHHLVHFVVHWHRLLTRKEAIGTPILLLFEPWMITNLSDPIPLVRLGMQDL